MVAGYTPTDIMRFRDRAAWHPYGKVVFHDETPTEAYREMFADLEVIQYLVKAYDPVTGHEIELDDRRLNVRSDTRERLGLVSTDYKICQNLELCGFTELLAKGNDKLVVESMGTLLGGKVFWCLVRADSFSVRGDDISAYMCAFNTHDATTSLQLAMTGIRAQCLNTVGMIFPDVRGGEQILGQGRFSCRHDGTLMSKLEDCREALMLYEHSVKSTQKIAEEIASKPVKSEQELRNYFFECYEANFGEIPTMASTKGEAVRRNRAMSALHSFERRWDDERTIGGDNMWSAFNAFTGLIQHDMKARGKDDQDRVEKRQYSNLLGLNNERSIRAMELALHV